VPLLPGAPARITCTLCRIIFFPSGHAAAHLDNLAHRLLVVRCCGWDFARRSRAHDVLLLFAPIRLQGGSGFSQPAIDIQETRQATARLMAKSALVGLYHEYRLEKIADREPCHG